MKPLIFLLYTPHIIIELLPLTLRRQTVSVVEVRGQEIIVCHGWEEPVIGQCAILVCSSSLPHLPVVCSTLRAAVFIVVIAFGGYIWAKDTQGHDSEEGKREEE